MISLYKSKTSSILLLLVLLSMVVHVRFFFEPAQIFYVADASLSSYFFSLLKPMPSLLVAFLYHLVVVIQALILNTVLSKYKFITGGYLPAMTYVLFTGLCREWSYLSPALLANFAVLVLIYQVLALYTVASPSAKVFNIALLTSGLVLFLPSFMGYVLLMLVAIFIVLPFRIRSLFLYLLGLLLPVYLCLCIAYLTNRMDWVVSFKQIFKLFLFEKVDNLFAFIAFLVVLFMSMIGFFIAQFFSSNFLLLVRKGWIIFALVILLVIPSIVLLFDYAWTDLLIVMLPMSALASTIFIYGKSRFTLALLFWILVALAIYNSFLGKIPF